MATMAGTFTRIMEPFAGWRERGSHAGNHPVARSVAAAAAVADADPYALPGLPFDNIYFHSKMIDNTRLIRQADPKAKGECLTAIAAVSAVALLIGSMVAPSVKGIMDSYRIQELKHEQLQLQTERRKLDVEEEKMISASRLDSLAPEHNLVRPAANQVIRLQPKAERSFAMNEMIKAR